MVSHWPVRDTPVALETRDLGHPASPRVGYGYRPPSAGLMDWLRTGGFQFVVVSLEDREAIQSGQVDAKVMDDDGIQTNYISVDYDAQSARSRAVAKLLQKRIDSYPARPTRALLSAVAGVPFSFHLFMGLILPLLIMSAVALGVFVTRRERLRGKLGIGLLYAAIFLVVLTFRLSGANFPGDESISSFFYYPPFGLAPVGLVMAAPLALGLAAFAMTLRVRAQLRWVVVPALLTLVAFFFAASSIFDPSGRWAISDVPQLLTLPALLVGGVASGTLAVLRGARL